MYYGNQLRSRQLIMLAHSVWIPDSKADIDKLKNLQLQMARYILKASRNTPRAALYGPLSTIQNSFRMNYLARIIDMDMYLMWNSHPWAFSKIQDGRQNALIWSKLAIFCTKGTLKPNF